MAAPPRRRGRARRGLRGPLPRTRHGPCPRARAPGLGERAAQAPPRTGRAGQAPPACAPFNNAAGTADGCCYLVSKLIRGTDLRTRLERGRPTPAESVAVIQEVALALYHAHERGLVHRDVKPGNILLDELGRP